LLTDLSAVPESDNTTSFSIFPNPPKREFPATEPERIDAVRVLAASNAIVGVLTIGVIAMQVGQQWAEGIEQRQAAEILSAEGLKVPVVPVESKKTQ
jgi:hypothetical protein